MGDRNSIFRNVPDGYVICGGMVCPKDFLPIVRKKK